METARSANSAQQARKYTTYERDANSSDEAMHRRYSPRQQRFDQPDPSDGSYDLTDPQSLNRYAYVNNDPVNFVDPLGLQRTVCYVNADGNIFCGSGSLFPPLTGADKGFSAFGGWGGGFNFNARPAAGFGIISLRENASDPFFLVRAWHDKLERHVEVPFPSMFGGQDSRNLGLVPLDEGLKDLKARVKKAFGEKGIKYLDCLLNLRREFRKKEVTNGRWNLGQTFGGMVFGGLTGGPAGALGGLLLGEYAWAKDASELDDAYEEAARKECGPIIK